MFHGDGIALTGYFRGTRFLNKGVWAPWTKETEYKVLLSCDWGAKQTFLGLFEEEASCSR